MPESADLLPPLLADPDPEVRGRAVAILGCGGRRTEDVAAFLRDPAPLVRLAAAEAIRRTKGWVRRLRPLAGDPDRNVALGAHLLLCESRDPATARASFLEVMKSRGEILLFDHARLATAGSMKPYMEWLEEDLGSFKKGDEWTPLLDDALPEIPEELLRPFAGRLVDLCARLEKVEGPRDDLAAAIARIRDPRAESAAAGLLAGTSADDFWDIRSAILEALLRREARPESDLTGALAMLAAGEGVDSGAAAMVLARWGIAGGAELLLRRARKEGADFLGEPFWEHAPESLLDTVGSLSPEHLVGIERIRLSRRLERAARSKREKEEARLRGEE